MNRTILSFHTWLITQRETRIKNYTYTTNLARNKLCLQEQNTANTSYTSTTKQRYTNTTEREPTNVVLI
jgi:hypothetical protein